MRTIVLTLSFIIFLFLKVYSQTVTDYDGNVYPTVTIGNQTWMAENLRVTHYSDGTILTDGSEKGEISFDDTTRYFFYYNDIPNYANEYGCLYTWFAAMRQNIGYNENSGNIQGACPEGWYIPNDADWQELEVFLGMDSIIAYSSYCTASDRENNIGNLLKTGGNTGFNIKYAGVRGFEGSYNGLGFIGEFLTSYGEKYLNEPVDTYTRLYYIFSDKSDLMCHYHGTNAAYSVRCIKDDKGTTSTLLNKTNELDFQICPNPFNSSTTIRFTLPKPEHVSLRTYNLTGQQMATLADEVRSAGEHQVQWQTEGLPGGVYLVKMQVGTLIETKKIIVKE